MVAPGAVQIGRDQAGDALRVRRALRGERSPISQSVCVASRSRSSSLDPRYPVGAIVGETEGLGGLGPGDTRHAVVLVEREQRPLRARPRPARRGGLVERVARSTTRSVGAERTTATIGANVSALELASAGGLRDS